MANFYATYSASAASSSTVTALQGTTPWVVAGNGTAGVSAAGVLSVQGITSGTPIPISGSITANNSSVGATGAAVPASGTYIAASVAGTLTGLVATTNGLKVDVIASALPSGAATETTLAAASAKLPATLGQKTMANSMAVVVASDQSAVPVSGSVTVSGTVAATQSGTWNITNVSGTVSLPTGAATETTLAAQSAKLPATLGQKTMANSLAVVIASDQSAVPVSGTVTATGTVAATQSGTWTVQPGNTANTTAWLVDQTNGTAAIFQDGSILFSSLTTNYQTVISTGGVLRNVSMRNNTNAVVVVSLDGGSTTAYTLDSGDAVDVDLKMLGLKIAASVNLQAKYTGGAPTSGSIRINGVY